MSEDHLLDIDVAALLLDAALEADPEIAASAGGDTWEPEEDIATLLCSSLPVQFGASELHEAALSEDGSKKV